MSVACGVSQHPDGVSFKRAFSSNNPSDGLCQRSRDTPLICHLEPSLTDTHITETSGKKRRPIFYGWYMVAASIAANTIFSAAYFQGFGVLIIPIERTFGWDRWVISAAMSLRQLESGIVSPAVGFLLDRFSARRLIFWSAVISGAGFIGLSFTNGIVTFFSAS